ncbi:MAG: adenylate/guanylate cyclase domain-containing protein [Acidimicrobiia bacterium]
MMTLVRRDLPSGTVTFLFTDIEGSTKLLHALGAEGYTQALLEHRRVLREAVARHGGVEVGTEGDSFFIAFPTAPGALEAAEEAQEALAQGPIRVRMGLHTGTAYLAEDDYVGEDVHKGARIAAAGHGGQVLLSKETRLLVEVELTDLGEHRLKDFASPVAIFQRGLKRFPPLKTISNTNLPRPASSFVGRASEVAEVVSLLSDGARLLTLTGPGGSGKTRLAIEAATELVPEFKAGVFWVGLAPLRDPSLVTEAIAQALGAKNGLADHIGERELLLLLDNLEQVVEVAPELSALVEACPNLRLLATSRELLRVAGEVEYPVLPLAEPEAVDLFCARARSEPDQAVLQLCRRLDNLPLAIELAAARSALSPRQILERLSGRLDLLKGGRGADPRQLTLRATIEWSYELLSPEEQRLFARLSVFAGGCTLESVEAVAEADLDTLQSLVDKSLLRHTVERFWMLETIRQYSAERLGEREEEETIHERHLDHFLALAERAYEGRLGAESKWSPIVEAERDNIRSALDFAHVSNPQAEAQLAGAIAPYWMLRGHVLEALERLRSALRRYGTRDRIRARALTHLGELDNAIPTLEEALGLWRELDNAQGEALALEAAGWAHDHHGDYPAARVAHEQSLTVRQRIGASDVEGALARAGLCHVLVASGEIERAETMAQELLAVATNSDAPLMQQLALHFLADCSLVAGDYTEAERRYLRALAYARTAGLVGRSTDEVLGVAMSLAGQGDAARAVRLAAAAYAEQAVLGKGTDKWWRTMQERHIGGARARLTRDEVEKAERAGTEASFDAVLDEVLGVGTTPEA